MHSLQETLVTEFTRKLANIGYAKYSSDEPSELWEQIAGEVQKAHLYGSTEKLLDYNKSGKVTTIHTGFGGNTSYLPHLLKAKILQRIFPEAIVDVSLVKIYEMSIGDFFGRHIDREDFGTLCLNNNEVPQSLLVGVPQEDLCLNAGDIAFIRKDILHEVPQTLIPQTFVSFLFSIKERR